MDKSLAGKVAIVTGAGTGLGAVMARTLAAAGAKIAGVGRNRDNLERVGDEISTTQGEGAFLPIAADVTAWRTCEAVVRQATEALGPIDILINNAGVGSHHARPAGMTGTAMFWQADPELWQQAIAINNNAGFFMARVAVLSMLERGWGRIVNNTTNFHTMLGKGRNCYGPGKAGLEASSAVWAKELAGTGVTVNVLIPGGATDTPIHPPSLSRSVMHSPEIMAAPIRWLCSRASDGVTGYRFRADTWDTSLPPDDAAEKNREPAAWGRLDPGRTRVAGFSD